jgi:hypothetical protein
MKCKQKQVVVILTQEFLVAGEFLVVSSENQADKLHLYHEVEPVSQDKCVFKALYSLVQMRIINV